MIRSDLPSLIAFPLERVLLNAYYIEDLKYVNRRLSIPSGLFSPPTEESTFDPRTQPTSSLPPLSSRTHEHPPSTTHGALRRPKSNLIDPKGEFPSISASLSHRPSLQHALRRLPSRSEIV